MTLVVSLYRELNVVHSTENEGPIPNRPNALPLRLRVPSVFRRGDGVEKTKLATVHCERWIKQDDPVF